MSAFVHLSLTSEAGLFSRVIIESMAYPNARDIDSAEALGDTFATFAGCNNESRLECMRNVSSCFKVYLTAT